METRAYWTHCRREGCERELPLQFQVYGFCNAVCWSMHKEEKEIHIGRSLAAYRREAEPNGGAR